MSWNQRNSGIIYNPPFVVDVQVSQRLDEFVPLFTGYAMDRIIALANNSQIRAMFRQLMEEDTQSFSMMVQDLASAVEYCIDSENLTPNQVEPAIRNLVQIVVDAYLAMAVKTYEAEFSQYLNQQQVRDIPAYIQALEDLKHAARHFYSGQAGGGGWRNERNVQRGWQPNDRGGNVNRASARRGLGNRNSPWDEPEETNNGGYRPANEGWPGAQVGRYGRQASGNTIWDTSPSQAKGKSNNGRTEEIVRPRRQFDSPAPAHPRGDRQRMHSINPKHEIVDGQTFVPARDDRDYPKVVNLDRMFDWILMQDGTQMRPAHLSTWKVSFDPQVPATPWYDPDTHILFHYKTPDGKVEQHALKREDSMKYLDHELDPNLRQKARDDAEAGNVAAPAWRLIEQIRPQLSSPLATTEPLGEGEEGIPVDRPSVPTDYLRCTSLSVAFKRICLRLKVHEPKVLKSAFEIYVDRAVLTSVANPDFEYLEKMARAESFKDLFDLLMEKPESDLVEEVDRRISTAITTALEQNMGLRGWSISNFRDDISDLLSMLREDYGDTVVDVLQTFAIEIISRNLVYFDVKELDKIRELVGLDADQIALVWRERCSMTRIPATAAALQIPDSNGTLVAESENPELFQTLDSVFDRTQDLPHSFNNRYLVTTDGIVYSIVRGYFNDRSVLLYGAGFTLQ